MLSIQVCIGYLEDFNFGVSPEFINSGTYEIDIAGKRFPVSTNFGIFLFKCDGLGPSESPLSLIADGLFGASDALPPHSVVASRPKIRIVATVASSYRAVADKSGLCT